MDDDGVIEGPITGPKRPRRVARSDAERIARELAIENLVAERDELRADYTALQIRACEEIDALMAQAEVDEQRIVKWMDRAQSAEAKLAQLQQAYLDECHRHDEQLSRAKGITDEND